MNNERNRRNVNWGSIIGWAIFLLALAGGPLARTIGRWLNGSFPWQILPIIVGGLVLLSIVVSVSRSFNQGRGGSDTRLPTSSSTTIPQSARSPFDRPASTIPQSARSPFDRPVPPPSVGLPSRGPAERNLPPAPRFEPLFNPVLVIIACVGVLALGVLAFVLLGSP